MKVPLTIIALALALLASSLAMPPFRAGPNGQDWQHSVPEGNSELYYSAREQALTPKYRLQDYGFTLLGGGLVMLLFRKLGRFTAPCSRFRFVAFGILAPIVTAAAFAFDLFQGVLRREFPPWADSLGIPLMGVPVILIFGLIWAFAHFIFLAGIPRRNNVAISIHAIRKAHPWLLLVSAATAALTALLALEGVYWFVVPGALWLYLYSSIAAVRHEPIDA